MKQKVMFEYIVNYQKSVSIFNIKLPEIERVAKLRSEQLHETKLDIIRIGQIITIFPVCGIIMVLAILVFIAELIVYKCCHSKIAPSPIPSLAVTNLSCQEEEVEGDTIDDSIKDDCYDEVKRID